MAMITAPLKLIAINAFGLLDFMITIKE